MNCSEVKPNPRMRDLKLVSSVAVLKAFITLIGLLSHLGVAKYSTIETSDIIFSLLAWATGLSIIKRYGTDIELLNEGSQQQNIDIFVSCETQKYFERIVINSFRCSIIFYLFLIGYSTIIAPLPAYFWFVPLISLPLSFLLPTAVIYRLMNRPITSLCTEPSIFFFGAFLITLLCSSLNNIVLFFVSFIIFISLALFFLLKRIIKFKSSLFSRPRKKINHFLGLHQVAEFLGGVGMVSVISIYGKAGEVTVLALSLKIALIFSLGSYALNAILIHKIIQNITSEKDFRLIYQYTFWSAMFGILIFSSIYVFFLLELEKFILEKSIQTIFREHIYLFLLPFFLKLIGGANAMLMIAVNHDRSLAVFSIVTSCLLIVSINIGYYLDGFSGFAFSYCVVASLCMFIQMCLTVRLCRNFIQKKSRQSDDRYVGPTGQ